jgi:cytidine deaminase
MKILKKYFLVFIFPILFSCSSPEKKNNNKNELTMFPSSELVTKALEARKNSYSPYSKYQVGAAIKTLSGKVFCGTNVENAAYGSTICAERGALMAAITAGSRDFESIAVVTKDGGSPCGSCRQMLNEFNPEMLIIMADETGLIKKQCNLSDLLIDAFGPKNVGK